MWGEVVEFLISLALPFFSVLLKTLLDRFKQSNIDDSMLNSIYQYTLSAEMNQSLITSEQKNQWVLERIKENWPSLTESMMNMLIELAVQHVHHGEKS